MRHQNIGYLDPELNKMGGGAADYKFTPQFAAGNLFTSSLLDTIVCQAFYNPQIIKVGGRLVGPAKLLALLYPLCACLLRTKINARSPSAAAFINTGLQLNLQFLHLEFR